jgi:crotonobetainyl-CoA:carnitine CoA-transferase CaiB-like acyl-CoA transferase
MIARVPLQPLLGLRVVDVTTSMAGPYCAEILAALGADVVKVERPDTGDDGRAWGPPFWNGESAMFLAVNAGKRSLAVSLGDERGREAVARLADAGDVFLQSLRPGLAERLGLGPETLHARNPRLVYCTVGAYGRVGPLAKEPGYDALMQAAGGLISVTGEPGRSGVRVGSSLVDMGTGMWSALGIVAALLERERSGAGVVVDTSLYETALAYVGYHLVGYLADGTVPAGQGTMFPMVAPYQVFPTRDGELMVAAGNDRLFALLCDVLELSDLAGDERFRTNPDRVRNRESLAMLVSDRLRERDSADWHARLTAAGVPAAPVADVADVVNADQTEALGMLQPLPHPEIPGLRLPAIPLWLDAERTPHRSPPPRVGEHTSAILAELGYPESEIAALEADGIIRTRSP